MKAQGWGSNFRWILADMGYVAKFAGMIAGLMAIVLLVAIAMTDDWYKPNVVLYPGIGATERSEEVVGGTEDASSIAQKVPAVAPSTAPLRDNVSERGTVHQATVRPVATSSNAISEPGPLIVERQISASTTPLPVVAAGSPGSGGALNQSDILTFVNMERVKVGLPTLDFNATLSQIALVKARDMIAKQYFAHVAPDGTDIAMLADRHGYEYLNIGENLALGDFVSSRDVMDGWMNSPGHRANILNKSYTEIGISAITGKYEGRTVWYAVQEFGRPMSLCPAPDKALEEKITANELSITVLGDTLAQLRSAIESPNLDEAIYNTRVNEYNAMVASYNALVQTTKTDITTYNAQVQTFNSCAGSS